MVKTLSIKDVSVEVILNVKLLVDNRNHCLEILVKKYIVRSLKWILYKKIGIACVEYSFLYNNRLRPCDIVKAIQ